MEKPEISHNAPPRIALIVPYFGPLPSYFPVWLESAKANPDVDFLFYTDQDVQIDAPNFRVTKTTLEALRERFSKKLDRPVSLPFAYKLCDYRGAYGLLFEEELRGYDFWGYCDIDLVFGQIRHFLTDEILSAHERFYNRGALSVYRNNEKMKHAFELPGSAFTLDEQFGPIHVSADECCGMNRICFKNQISWYNVVDCAHLNDALKTRLEMRKSSPNYPAQIFCWMDGRAFQRYADGDRISEKEFVFIHWYRKRPIPERVPAPGEAVVITADKLLVRSPQDLTVENMLRWNPSPTKFRRLREEINCRLDYYSKPFKCSPAERKLWIRNRVVSFCDTMGQRIDRRVSSLSKKFNGSARRFRFQK